MHAEAHALLAPIYGWCTGSFDTTDLCEAAEFLKTLSRQQAVSVRHKIDAPRAMTLRQ